VHFALSSHHPSCFTVLLLHAKELPVGIKKHRNGGLLESIPAIFLPTIGGVLCVPSENAYTCRQCIARSGYGGCAIQPSVKEPPEIGSSFQNETTSKATVAPDSATPAPAMPTTVKLTSNRLSSCPVAVQNAIGLYNSSKRQSDFSNAVLLTACNNEYSDMLSNWEFLAGRLNLKWAVLAMDDEIYQNLGPARAVPSNNYSVSGEVEFRSAGFNILSCNKMRSVLSILQDCQVDVIFSDADNVFFHDPFQHDLGNLIKSGAYDYVYQVNRVRSKRPRSHSCLTKGQIEREGNTGFYYISWKSQTMKSIITEALSQCNHPKNKLDDQTLFWRALHKEHNVKKGSWQHCQQVNASVPSAITTHPRKEGGKFSLCCLDPFYYPTGVGSEANPNDLISFHANLVKGKKGKISKLYNARPKDHLGWHWANYSDPAPQTLIL
jgi:hypothetical protein